MSCNTLHQAMEAVVQLSPDDFFVYELLPVTDSSICDHDAIYSSKAFTSPKIYAHIAQDRDGIKISFFIEKTTHTQEIFDKHIKSTSMQRADYLWLSDCFECFLANKESAEYIEINFAPDGRYNIYRFDSYRTPDQMPPILDTGHALFMRQITALDDGYVLAFHIHHHTQALRLSQYQFNLTAILYPTIHSTPLAIYYAVKHASPPDFHDRTYWL
ncbi:hypothetical protein B0180_01225 [Moraxella canis]|uniref:Uncharacterized protein n=1 Tax=Moraxella canis TaxID=90239 RepID=A0A1S9ZP95_9GAMM|nr:hypothetical protein B0180_01225 [Moraxella canis]